MKMCRKCGTEIINGTNGCMLLGDICNTCYNGGKPIRYAPPKSRINEYYSNNEESYFEGECIGDYE